MVTLRCFNEEIGSGHWMTSTVVVAVVQGLRMGEGEEKSGVGRGSRRYWLMELISTPHTPRVSVPMITTL
jgi:hypothetical protein